MAIIRSSDYDKAVKQVRDSALFYHMVYKTKAVRGKSIVNLTREEMISNQVMHPYESATHEFMLAANEQFRKLEELNPDYRVEGFRALGTVSEAVIKAWKEARETVMAMARIDEPELDRRLSAGETTADILNKAVHDYQEGKED